MQKEDNFDEYFKETPSDNSAIDELEELFGKENQHPSWLSVWDKVSEPKTKSENIKPLTLIPTSLSDEEIPEMKKISVVDKILNKLPANVALEKSNMTPFAGEGIRGLKAEDMRIAKLKR